MLQKSDDERNRYGADFVIVDDMDDDEKDFVWVDSLLTVVIRKVAHPRNCYTAASHDVKRHVTNKAQMLALVLYTGCDCTYAMCKAERGGDYETWKWFSLLLRRAIASLPPDESVVYSGEWTFGRC